MSIPSHILEQLNNQADLVGLVGKYTTLKKSGGTYRGKCPFHKGNSNSFSLNANKNLYHCFKCGVSGNAFSFLKDYENLTFMEAVDELSRQTGIDVPKSDNKDLLYKRHTNQSNFTTDSMHRANTSEKTNLTDDNSVLNSNVDHTKHTASNLPPYPPKNSNTNPITPTNTQSVALNNKVIDPVSYPDENNQPYFNDDSISSYYDSQIPYDSLNNSQNLNHTNQFNSLISNQDLNPVSNSSDAMQNAVEGNLYDLLEKVQTFYETNLYKHYKALQYFKNRGLSDATIKHFSLGYAPSGWQHLEQAFAADIEGLRVLGLVRSSKSGRDYDLLRDRVIFPIKDNQGRTIGFGGRALDNEITPKYINSSDSPVFHKQYVLYGYYESRTQRAKDWLVVEGYMDVIALYQAGIYGAVASMGTFINEKQISRLLNLNPVLTLSFDGDEAGQKAAWRTLQVALPVLSDDKELRFLTLPNGHDPDTYINLHGVDAMRSQIQQALPLSHYIYANLSERYDLTIAEGKAKLMAKVRELTNNLPKGSSFKHLLNNDIYQKISGRKNIKATTAHDALLDFDSGMTTIDQLELCLLFTPHILKDDPVLKLWHQSSVTTLSKPTNNNISNLPELPSWKDFEDVGLLKLVEVIVPLLPHLPKDRNKAAHFILANLPKDLQQELSYRWHSFWSNLQQREIIAIEELTEELLIHLMLNALKKQMQQAKDIVTINQLNKQRQALSNWHKLRQAEQSSRL